jgi:hypothetical protein
MKRAFEQAGKPTGRLVVLLSLFALIAGCESLTGSQSTFSSSSGNRAAEVEARRSRFLKSREPADLQWLLSNAVRSGMSRGEVSQALGESGQLVRDDSRFKRNGGHYRENDTIWKWGPDSRGQSIFLAFRGGKLVNFDPDEFAETEDDGTQFIGDPKDN